MHIRNLLCAALLVNMGCSNPTTKQIVLENKSDFALNEKTIKISRNDIDGKTSLFPILTTAINDTLVAQLDDIDGDGQWDELFFLVDLNPREVKTLQLAWSKTQPAYPKRTSVRLGARHDADLPVTQVTKDVFLPHELPWRNGFQPYQADGPMWENDKVGFRSYLDGRNSKDLFGKKVSHMSPETVGIDENGFPEDNYHVMEDWGRDILSVGNSLGLGGFSLMIEDRLRRIGAVNGDEKGNVDSTIFSIYQEGPIRSILNFQYKNWRPLDENRAYDIHEKIEIWPGFHGYKTTLDLGDLKGDETVIVGLVNSRTDKPLVKIYENDKWVVLGTHDKQTYEKEWYLGLALVVPKEGYLGFIEAPVEGAVSTTFLAKLRPHHQISYFTIGAWELSDPVFNSEAGFHKYVENFTQQISADVHVKID
jgi:hypothetical protein